jgi:hypothetical protein
VICIADCRIIRWLADWFDPFIGVRGRYNFCKPFYLTAEGDVGGFGIGSEITCQGYGAIGCQITRNIFPEAGYRVLYDDYNTTSFVYQAVTMRILRNIVC